MLKTKNELLHIIIGLFVGLLIVSNILTAKQFSLGELSFTCGVIIFPLVYVINDLLVEVYGYETTKKIIFIGFAAQLIAVIAYHLAIALPSPIYSQESADAFAMVLGSSGRILFASFVAYLIGSILNAKVMVKLKERFHDKLMFRCVSSTLIGEGVDSTIFLTVAFFGVIPSAELLVLIVCEAIFKVCLEVAIYPATRKVIRKAERLSA